MMSSFKSGFVAIVGRPNAGKSTLVNALVGRKVSIVTPVAQTTRNRIQGVVHRPGAQIVLIDTPGVHRPGRALGRKMMDEVHQAVEGIDVLAFIVDATEEFGGGDRYTLRLGEGFGGPAILLLNKIDRMAKERLLPLIARYSREREFTEIIPISALKGDGLPLFLEKVTGALPEGPAYFPADQYTDQPERFLAAEIVREKAMLRAKDEVPHGVGVVVEAFEETPKLLRIRATIYVEREGQKGILIGKGGSRMKQIGTEARLELERLLGAKIFLELYVKHRPGWRENRELVRMMDWREQLERIGEE